MGFWSIIFIINRWKVEGMCWWDVNLIVSGGEMSFYKVQTIVECKISFFVLAKKEILVIDNKKSMRLTGESIICLDDKVQEWWFISLQTPQQVKRLTPSGYWKKTGKDRNVKARDANRVIGTKKTLVFHIGRGSGGVRNNWLIHEYHLLAKDVLSLSPIYSLQ